MKRMRLLTILLVSLSFSSPVWAQNVELPYREGFSKKENFKSSQNREIIIAQNVLSVKNDEILLIAGNLDDWSGYTFESDVKVLSWEKLGEFGVDFLCGDADNFLRLSFVPSKNKIQLLQKEKGKTTLLKEKRFSISNGDYHLKTTATKDGEIISWINENRIIWNDGTDQFKGDFSGLKGTPKFFSFLSEVQYSNFKAYPNDPAFVYDVKLNPLNPTEAEIAWKTNYNVISEIAYDTVSFQGETNEMKYRFKSGQPGTAKEHKMVLTNLRGGTKYFYRIKAVDEYTTITDELSFDMPEVAGISTANKNNGYAGSRGIKVISFLLSFTGLALFIRAQKKELSLEAITVADVKKPIVKKDSLPEIDFEIPDLDLGPTNHTQKTSRGFDSIRRK